MRPKKRVVLVTADPLRLDELHFLLALRGFAVNACADQDATLQTLRGLQCETACRRDTVDLLLVDAVMPDRDALIAEARKMHPALPLLLVSAKDDAKPNILVIDTVFPVCGPKPRTLIARVQLLTQRKTGPKPVRSSVVFEEVQR